MYVEAHIFVFPTGETLPLANSQLRSRIMGPMVKLFGTQRRYLDSSYCSTSWKYGPKTSYRSYPTARIEATV